MNTLLQYVIPEVDPVLRETLPGMREAFSIERVLPTEPVDSVSSSPFDQFDLPDLGYFPQLELELPYR